ncbi:MAG: HAMP domain-containing histidine kinase [Muribaculaceae bacterium]|nr:HAMP domain-containing histidine kinase [Roseburia sp.]MCM1430640.1 HAMP domain-containing histidine kinase [Muribaculaceae bacterium]MCM1491907.1 HAMP domain-containing histidine kinase [Muribaculaceae bacterium]
MKSVPKLIRRFVGVLFISFLLLLLLNITVFLVVGLKQTASGHPYTTAQEAGAALRKTQNGYVMEEAYARILEEADAWAICIDNRTHERVWQTENLPEGIPESYSLSDISDLTLGYVQDYPTYVGDTAGGIVVVGYPVNRYWKSMWPTWDYYFIKNLPKTILVALLCNVLMIFLIYITVTGGLIKSIAPILAGIKSLTMEKRLRVKEKGVFSELAFSINQVAGRLENQELLLAKKEQARANWIAGVSHDIRTPLSVIMGYAARLEEALSGEERQKAAVIVRQSQRMRNLVNDLNLASKLEYNMQPLHREEVNLIALVRQVAVDFMNLDIEGKYPLEWTGGQDLKGCTVNADKALLKRAVGNLIQNSISHNAEGCTIYVGAERESDGCTILVADDGAGVSDAQMERLNAARHYMVCDENTTEQSHGLGLLLVRQIIAAHGGSVTIRRSRYGGFEAALYLPREIGQTA